MKSIFCVLYLQFPPTIPPSAPRTFNNLFVAAVPTLSTSVPYAFLSLLYVPSFCSPSHCPAGLWPQLSWVCFRMVRFSSCSYKSLGSSWNQWLSPADSIDEVPIPRLSHRTALVSCNGDAEVPLPRPAVSCLPSSPFPPIVSPQPALQAGGQCPLGYASFRFASSCSSLCAWETKKKETTMHHTCEGISYSQQPEACHMLKPQNMTTLFDVTQHRKRHDGITRLLPSPCWMYEGEAETCMLPTNATPFQA
jgi:hypothetical protein